MGRFAFFLWSIPISLCLLFIPVVLETNVYYDVLRRKFAFSVYGYKLIKLTGGYIATYEGGIAVHTSKNKATIIPYKQLNNERKRFSFMKTFRLKSFAVTTETGASYLMPVLFTQATASAVVFLKTKKKAEIRSRIVLENGEALKISLQCILFCNLFMLLQSILAFIKEKLKKSCRKKLKKSIA